MKVSVLECGGWGTALSMSLSSLGHEATLHSLHGHRAAELRSTHENRSLPGVRLPDSLLFADGFEGIRSADAVIFATPSYALRDTAHALRGVVRPDTILVSAAKGIESCTGMRMTQIIADELGAMQRVVALSGPSHAEEVARCMPTGCVCASESSDAACFVQELLMGPVFRLYTSQDVVGVELCGALKNVIAIAVGICDGLGYGDNTIAMLTTRGLFEMSVLGTALGARKETFSGLAGVGDLIVTCNSRHSRNRLAGKYLGQGMSADEAVNKVGATVEGIYAARASLELAEKVGVELPVTCQVYQIVYEGRNARDAAAELMSRSKKDEFGN